MNALSDKDYRILELEIGATGKILSVGTVTGTIDGFFKAEQLIDHACSLGWIHETLRIIKQDFTYLYFEDNKVIHCGKKASRKGFNNDPAELTTIEEFLALEKEPSKIEGISWNAAGDGKGIHVCVDGEPFGYLSNGDGRAVKIMRLYPERS